MKLVEYPRFCTQDELMKKGFPRPMASWTKVFSTWLKFKHLVQRSLKRLRLELTLNVSCAASSISIHHPISREKSACSIHREDTFFNYSLITAIHTSASMGRQERNKANIQISSKKGQVEDRGIQ